MGRSKFYILPLLPCFGVWEKENCYRDLTDRLCSLAYCELYIMAALVATKVLPRAKLVDTSEEDISYDHDCIVLQTKKGSISVKIEIE